MRTPSLVAAVVGVIIVSSCTGGTDHTGANPGVPMGVAPVLRVSQASLLTKCPGLPGTQVNYAVEPSLAVSPTDSNNLIAAWQQDRSYAARGNVVGYSTDGGRQWNVVVVPGATTCTKGQLGVADAWLTFDRAGTAYLESLAGRAGGDGIVSSVIVNTSTDGGRSWSAPTRVTTGSAYDDKPSIATDPTHAGVVYVVWQRFRGLNTCKPDCPSSIYFSRSQDSALTWSAPRAIAPNADRGQQTNSRLIVLPDRSLHIFYEREEPETDNHDAAGFERVLYQVSSHDAGTRWSTPREVVRIHHYYAYTPTKGRFYSLYDEAVTSDDHGAIYLALTENESAESTAHSKIQLVVSRDGGDIWAPAVTIAAPRGFASLPTIAASITNGNAVTWYDFAADTPATPGTTLTYRAALQRPGSERWSNRAITSFELEKCGTFSEGDLPGPKLPWIGEYFGLVPTRGERFGTAFVTCAPEANLGIEDINFTSLR